MTKQSYDANSISILEGLEAVRLRPGMYIGSVGTKGLNHLIYEIADNAVDEHLAGYCSQINVTLNNEDKIQWSLYTCWNPSKGLYPCC